MKPCVLWDGYRNNGGYGYVRVAGKRYGVHRLVCEFTHGPPPPGKNDAMHSCDVRHCYEPSHLSWGSRAENLQDAALKGRTQAGDRHWSALNPEKRPRGERHGGAKLTDAAASDIRQRVASGARQTVLAQEYHISKSQVSRICLGQRRAA